MKKIKFLCTMMLFLCIVYACKTNAEASAVTAECAAVVTNKAGFHPSSSNYASLKATVIVDYVDVSLRLRVVNSKGKYVYQKTVRNLTEDTYVWLKWNGKACKSNSAGIATGKYVPKGSYTLEALAYYTSGGKKIYSKKISKPFTVSYSAPSGVSGRKNQNYMPMLTGYQEDDYLAEKMCKAAGVTSLQTPDERVKKIYHWMTKNFKHTHYEQSSYKKYYDLTKLKTEVKNYRTASKKKAASGDLVFTYNYPPYLSWNMERRIGVCTENAGVFAILCNHAGVDAGMCHGFYLNRNGTKAGHSWNYAYINGTRYFYDIDVEIQNYGKGQGDYYWYKKTRSQANVTHEFHSIY